MRTSLKLSLLAVFACSVALFAPATGGAVMSTIPPTVNTTGNGSTAYTISLFFTLNPNGSTTTFALEYLEHVGCDEFNPGELDNLSTPGSQELMAGYSAVSLGATISDLKPQTGYCVRVTASNQHGTTKSSWSYIETQSLPVALGEMEVSKNAYAIRIQSSVMPGTYSSDPSVLVEYYASDEESECVDTADPSTVNIAFEGVRGFAYEPFSAMLDGLEHSTYYCVKVTANNQGSTATTGWQVIKTTTPEEASIYERSFVVPEESPPGLSVYADDNGASEDMAKFSVERERSDMSTMSEGPSGSSLSAMAAESSSEMCGPESFVEATLIESSKVNVSGSGDYFLPFDGLEVGKRYCAGIFLKSAWGPEWSTADFIEFDVYAAPTVSSLSGSGAWDSIDVAAEFNMNNGEGGWEVNYYAKGEDDCEADRGKSSEGLSGEVTSDLMETKSVDGMIDGLEPNTAYCLIISVRNSAGTANYSTGVEVSTKDVVAPDVPTDLAASGITATGATLSWDSSTDDHGTVSYKVFKGDNQVGTPSGTSFAVLLTCGETSHFRVSAIDDSGNESEKSESLAVTGAACPVDPPDGETGGGGDGDVCLTGFTSKSTKLKVKGKKKVKVTLSSEVSDDGQSVVISLSGKGVKGNFTLGKKPLKGSPTKVTVKQPGTVNVVITVKGGKGRLSGVVKSTACADD